MDDDSADVRRAQAGDFASFERLVHAHQQRIYDLALRMVHRPSDAQEVVQETFLSVVRHLASFRGEAKFSTWLTRIATNHALKMLQRRRREDLHRAILNSDEESYADLPHPDFIAVWSESPEQVASRRETRELLKEALDSLDEKYRLVFLLRDVQELSTRETAETLGLSESNVKIRLLRARLMLRERLTRVLGDPSKRLFPDHDHSG